MILRIGSRAYVVSSLASASALYNHLRDASGEGYRTWPVGHVGRKYRLSYNGRVWKVDRDTGEDVMVMESVYNEADLAIVQLARSAPARARADA